MRKLSFKNALLAVLLVVPTTVVLAQSTAGPRYELGGGVIGSFYDKKAFTSPVGNADAGFDSGLGASVWVGHHMYPKISGEIRYDMLRNNLTLQGSGANASFAGDSHAIHYDLHFHTAPNGSRVRPFFLVGGGVKLFRGTGTERAFQPLSQIAILTQTTELAGLLTFGAGVKIALNERILLRLEFRDNLTRFPKKVITPNRGTGGEGWLNNFAPSVGLSVLF